MRRPSRLAQAVAAVAIAFYWCISSLATTVGVTTLATAVGAATTPAQAGEKINEGDAAGKVDGATAGVGAINGSGTGRPTGSGITTKPN